MNADQYCWEAWTLRWHHARGGKSHNIPERNGGFDGKFIEVNGGFSNAILPQGTIAAMEIISKSSRGKCSVAMLNYCSGCFGCGNAIQLDILLYNMT